MMASQTPRLLAGFLSLSILCSGCAISPDNRDPFEDFNRGVHAFNTDLDNALLKPIAETYKTITPAPVDKGVTNFFNNIDDFIVVINDLFQFKFKEAGADSTRFLINSTVGVLGLFDFAADWGFPKRYEDFGQTLGYWGVGDGAYLVLPFFGPSSLRDTGGKIVDLATDPRTYLQDSDVRNFVMATNGLRAIDFRADLLNAEQVLDTAALDNYAFVRDAYFQRREFLIYDGNPPAKIEDVGDLFSDIAPNPSAEAGAGNAATAPATAVNKPKLSVLSPQHRQTGFNIYLQDVPNPLIPYPE